jgi:hypothetical protein
MNTLLYILIIIALLLIIINIISFDVSEFNFKKVKSLLFNNIEQPHDRVNEVIKFKFKNHKNHKHNKKPLIEDKFDIFIDDKIHAPILENFAQYAPDLDFVKFKKPTIVTDVQKPSNYKANESQYVDYDSLTKSTLTAYYNEKNPSTSNDQYYDLPNATHWDAF